MSYIEDHISHASSDEVVHQLAVVSHRSKYTISSKMLLSASLQLQKHERLLARYIVRSLYNLKIDVNSISSYFGCLRENHVLGIPYQPLGFSPTEPQLIKAICHFLNANGDLRVSKKRTQSFLHALLYGLGNHAGFFAAIKEIDSAVSLNVVAEKVLRNGKRIDLFFYWELPGGVSFVVAIEAKFNHQVTSGQLPAYKKEVLRLSKGGYWILVLLTPDGHASRRNKDWCSLTWRTLLTRWECLLDPDEQNNNYFTLLRKVIWDKL